MSATKNRKPTPSSSSEPMSDASEIDRIAEAYLDLWQENLKRWATDPQALERALAEKSAEK